jgi:hypothetical protein
LRAARFEVARRRSELLHVGDRELERLASVAADAALMRVVADLDHYRGSSRFTTWAAKFALLEAAVRLRKLRTLQSARIAVRERLPERSFSELDVGPESRSSCFARGERVGHTDHPAIPMNEQHDHGGRQERGGLEQDEDRVVSMQRQGADHDAAREPHRPRAPADAGRTVLAGEVDDLREIGEHRDGYAGNANELKHASGIL